MDIKIRSEHISDYNGIANVHYEAFLGWHPDSQFVSEFLLVDLLRHNSMYDPELSLVAELEGRIVGHVLFSPFTFIVLGVEQRGVVLAPAAVKPEFQRKGIGGMLIEEGHKRAKEKGFTFSLLCGHEGYYPRFGYKQSLFSLSGTKVNITNEGFNHEGFIDRPVNEQDISWLTEAWKNQHGSDALAIFPGANISEWNNHGYTCRSAVVSKDNRILGYARYDALSDSLIIKELVAKNEEVPEILRFLAWKKYGKAYGEVRIAQSVEKLHASINRANHFEIVDEQTAHKAFMIRILEQDSLITRYCEQVEKGQLKPGIISFPAMYDLA